MSSVPCRRRSRFQSVSPCRTRYRRVSQARDITGLLEDNRNPRNEQNDPVRDACDRLVQFTQEISIDATALERRNDSTADFVRHEEHGGGRLLNRVHNRHEMTAPGWRNTARREQAAAICCQAVNKKEICGCALATDDLVQIRMGLDGFPVARAFTAMRGNLSTHLCV